MLLTLFLLALLMLELVTVIHNHFTVDIKLGG